MTTASTPTVVTQVERRRGCGYRKPSKGGKGVGIYLVADAPGAPCGRLPFPLDVCPCCSGGIKPSRAWTWIDPSKLFVGNREVWTLPSGQTIPCRVGPALCATCPLGRAIPQGRHGLLWIGEAFYPTPDDYLRESRDMGLSRKIPAIPKGFVLGETWVFLAHRFAVAGPPGAESERTPGVFSLFRPTGVDLVIDDAAKVPERAQRLVEQIGAGARIVKVIPDEQLQATLPFLEGVTA